MVRLKPPPPKAVFAAAAEPAPRPAPTVRPSVLGAGSRLEGRLSGPADLTVEGAFRGDITVTTLVVAVGGHVIGKVDARSVEVHGRLDGPIVANRVHLAATARVEGAITYDDLHIAPGAVFFGATRRMKGAGKRGR